MDDETYIKKDFAQVPGHSFKGKDVENKFKCIQTENLLNVPYLASTLQLWSPLPSIRQTADFDSGYLHQGVSEKEIAAFYLLLA